MPFIVGKGRRARMVVCPNALTHRLKSYAYDNGIDEDTHLSSINRKRAWPSQAAEEAGTDKRVYPRLRNFTSATARR